MKVTIPSALYSYTGGAHEVEAAGATLDELLRDLDARYPGFRFRIVDEQGAIRPHIRFFVNREMVRTLAASVSLRDEVVIVGALSGG